MLVQANHGERARFQVNGVPVGQLLSDDEVPVPVTPEEQAGAGAEPGGPADAGLAGARGAGSIIVVVATDAPLLPVQRRASPSGLGSASHCSAPAAAPTAAT